MKRHYLWPLVVLCSAALASLALLGTSRLQGGTGEIELLSAGSGDYFFFRLELVGQDVGDYGECFGLGSSNEIKEDTTQMGGLIVRQKTPGVLEWHNITLKRNGPSDVRVASWRKALETGDLKAAIRNGAIVMYKAASSEPVARWEFRNGWVASLRLDGAVEELTIVHEGLERMGVPSPTTIPASRSRTS